MRDPSIHSVLEARARALARRPDIEDAAETLLVIVLTVAGERYGVDAGYVEEVGVAETITSVPGLSPVWAGLVNVRGRIFPVLDLQTYLGLPPPDAPPRTPGLVFLSDGTATTGVLSDTAPELRRIPVGSLAAPMTAGSAAGAVIGVTSDFLSILNVETVLNDARMVARSIGGVE